MVALTESVGQWLDSANAIGERFDRFVEVRISRRPDDFETGDAAVFFDPKFYQHRIFRPCGRNRSRLNPFAIKTVMQHAAIPTELRFTTRPARATNARARRGSFAVTSLSSLSF